MTDALWHLVEVGEYDSYEWFLCRCTTGKHGSKFPQLGNYGDGINPAIADYVNKLEREKQDLQVEIERWEQRYYELKSWVDGMPSDDALTWQESISAQS